LHDGGEDESTVDTCRVGNVEDGFLDR
jgi:hypothetical protein